MKRTACLLSFISCLFLAACDTPDTLRCGDWDVDITVHDESITAVINGDSVELAHVIAASGARFEGVLNETNVVMWAKGDNWMMILDDADPIDCR